jgi:DNA-directed RNA polymerase subunit L
MKINVLKHDGNELRIELVGEGHSFCNALQSILLKDGTLDFAGYNLPHPLVGQPTIYVRGKGRRDLWRALLDATESLEKELEQIQKTFLETFRDETTSDVENNE